MNKLAHLFPAVTSDEYKWATALLTRATWLHILWEARKRNRKRYRHLLDKYWHHLNDGWKQYRKTWRQFLKGGK